MMNSANMPKKDIPYPDQEDAAIELWHPNWGPKPRRSWEFLNDHFNTILIRMGCANQVPYRGCWVGSEYNKHKSPWEAANIPEFHSAACLV